MRASILTLSLIISCIASGQVPGTLDATFGTGGVQQISPGIYSGVLDVGHTSNGDIIAQVWFPDTDRSGLQRRLSNGTLDQTYGSGGTFLLPEGFWPSDMVVLSDDRVLLAGSTQLDVPPYTQIALIRVLPNGGFDATFGTNGVVQPIASEYSSWLSGVAMGSGGSVLACGSTTVMMEQGGTSATVQVGLLMRLQANGSLDPAFAGTGYVTMSHSTEFTGWTAAEALGVLADGRTVVGGRTMTSFPQEAIYVARYNANGSLDNSFGSNGTAILPYANDVTLEDLALSPTGEVLLAGVTNNNGWEEGAPQGLYLGRLQANGQYDTGFGQFGIVHYAPENEFTYEATLRLLSDGSAIVLRSGTDDLDGTSSFSHFMHLRVNGTFDPELGDNGLVSFDIAGEANQVFVSVDVADNGALLFAGVTGGAALEDGEMNGKLVRFHGPAVSVGELGRSEDGFGLTSRGLLSDGENPITVIMPRADRVVARLLDVHGREVDVLYEGMLTAGPSKIGYAPPTTLTEGTYILEVVAPFGRRTAKLVRGR